MSGTRFSGDRIGLRALEPADAGALQVWLNDPALLGRRYLPGGVPDRTPLSRGQVTAALEEWAGARKAFRLGIELLDTGELVGHAGCNWNWDTHCPTVSVVVAPENQRDGIGSEALDLILSHLFEDTPAHNVSGWVAGWNEAGLAFAEEHGFTQSGRIPRGGLRDGVWFEDVIVDILRPEWTAEKERSDAARR